MLKNVIILAAGMGTRMKHLTNDIPKCLIPVNGISILHNMLENLSEAGVTHCTIVIGYLGNMIIDEVGDSYKGIQINYIENKDYETTNDMYSLWLAKDIIKRGAFLIESDIFLKRGVLEEIQKKSQKKSYYITGKYRDDRHNILISTKNRDKINNVYDSDIVSDSNKNTYLISAGILIIQPDFGKKLSSWLDSFVKEKQLNVYYDLIISKIISGFPLYSYEIPTDNWIEIDRIEDLQKAERIFKRDMK
jgi:NDP-sugar pyrophosphorylase family protein